MRLFWPFFRRDLQMELAYKMKLATDLFYVTVVVVLYYYVSRLIGARTPAQLAQYHCDYFSFVMVGIILANLLQAGLQNFSENIRKFIAEGSLEAMLASPTPHYKLILYSATWPFAYALGKSLLQLLVAYFAFGFALRNLNLLSTVVCLGLSLVMFMAIGVISASALIVFKRGDPVNWLVIQLSHIFGGILFPIALLPHWAQGLAWLFPVKFALEATRAAMLTGTSLAGMTSQLFPLLAFTIALLPVSAYACSVFVNASKRAGSLSAL